MLQEYDGKNTRVYDAAMLTADFSEWLDIKLGWISLVTHANIVTSHTAQNKIPF